jgi:hypothetical protein
VVSGIGDVDGAETTELEEEDAGVVAADEGSGICS